MNRCASADLALDYHPAPMGLHDAPADRQTQTGAAHVAGPSCIDPIEPPARVQVRQVFRRGNGNMLEAIRRIQSI